MIDTEDSEKLETLNTLLLSIKNKTKTILSQTKYLNQFNKRLELLLMCFKAYSIEDKEFLTEAVSNKTEQGNTKKNKEKLESQPKKATLSPKGIDPLSKVPKIVQNIENNISRIFEQNKNSKNIAMTIIDLINKNGLIKLDELVKSIKMSKYKLIEVLNTLIIEKIVIKSFEKGFVYRIRNEYL